MANVTIPSHTPSDRALAQQQYLAEAATEEAKKRRASLDAPWYNEKLDPTNFGANEYLDPQHIAMFNGTEGGRRHASFPERTLDTGLSFNPTPQALRGTPGSSGKDVVSPQHPEVLTAIIQDLWSPSTSHGALGQAIAVATDAPPQMAGPAEPPMTISPPLDPEDLPPPPEMEVLAPEGSSRAKRQADWAAQGGEPTQQPADGEAAEKKRREAEEKKRQADEEKRRQQQQDQSKK